MLVRQALAVTIDQADHTTIDESLSFVGDATVDGALAAMVPHLTEQQRFSVAMHCVVGHVAALVFPASVVELIAGLRERGLAVDDAVPSVVVRDRLVRRYALPDPLDVAIVHVNIPAVDGFPRMVELFALAVTPGSTFVEIADRERVERNESHLALDVRTPDEVVMAGLRGLLIDHGGLVADGGGYNNFEDCTVLYFRCPVDDHSAGERPYHRLELRGQGNWPGILAEHCATGDPAKRLLELMTGAWTTQAIAVAAELGLADQLPDQGLAARRSSIGELADRLAVDPDGLGRLLRYLASVGVVEPVGESYALTAVGEPLRRTAHHSLRPLALLYGGPFYQSFGGLAHAVRTGREAFEVLFGQNHFDYFAEHSALAELFDDAMAASAPMFEPIPELVDVSGASVVVDVAGGNGQLLGRILGHAPHLRGVLFERAHVLSRARQRMADLGCADRCEFVAGDFGEAVPAGGDVYLLSRILHDWDDQQCLTILRRCADSIRPGGQLLLVERPLPAGGTSSLAVAWDLHMLCNVGGRERTTQHYAQLLAAAGFELVKVSGLPLDGCLLQARPRGTTEHDVA